MTFEQKKEKIIQLIKNNPEYRISGFGVTIGTYINSRSHMIEHINKAEDVELQELSEWILIMFKQYADDYAIDKKYYDNDLEMPMGEKIRLVRFSIVTNQKYKKTFSIYINRYIVITKSLIIADLREINDLEKYSEFLLDCYLMYYSDTSKDPCNIYKKEFARRFLEKSI